MLNDYTVDVIYKNRSLESVSKRTYPLIDYCQEQKLNLMHIITDVENAFYDLQDNKSKDEWNPDAIETFQRIRHRLLDVANGIERLPKNLNHKGVNVCSVNGTDYIASIVNQYTK
jgi:hypothetical protein